MRIVVDRDKCQCSVHGPGVFDLDASGSVVYDATPRVECLAEVLDAEAGCPTQAITVEPERR